jgi:hypothetical protein
MARSTRPRRTPLLRQLAIVAFAFLVGQLISTRVLPSSLSVAPRLLVFLVVYVAVYVAVWRLTEGVRGRPVERRRR